MNHNNSGYKPRDDWIYVLECNDYKSKIPRCTDSTALR